VVASAAIIYLRNIESKMIIGKKIIFIATVSLLFAGCTSQQVRQIPPVHIQSNQQNTSATPNLILSPAPIAPSAINSWKTYVDPTYHFSFSYPPNLSIMGSIAGPTTVDSQLRINLGDASTGMLNTDAAFDGLDVYVVPNAGNLSFQDYVKREKQAQLKQSKDDYNFDNQKICSLISKNIGEKDTTWTVIKKCSWDSVIHYYHQLPNSNHIISVSVITSTSKFPQMANQIISTFKFFNQVTQP